MPNASWHTQHASSGIPTSFPFFNNAARNLLEIIADAARSDAGGDYPVRIFTIGMGTLINMSLGTIPETSASVLQRVANDRVSVPDFNPAQLAGNYYYAPTASDVAN